MNNPNDKASSPMTFAIFCATKYDVRNCNLTRGEASQILDLAKQDKARALEVVSALPGAIKKGEVKPAQDWQALYNRAHEAGMKAGNEVIPTPMVVQQHANMADDNSPVAKQWLVNEGACGFAWVVIRPGTCSFAKWLKNHDLARAHYGGGMSIWVGQFNQSITRKEAYADAFAAVVREAGISAYAGSRLD